MSLFRSSAAPRVTTTVGTRSEVLQRDHPARFDVGQALLNPLPSTVDAVQKCGDVLRIRVGLIKGRGQERASEGAGAHMGPLGDAMQLLGIRRVEDDVDPGRSFHSFTLALPDTTRAPPEERCW